MDEEFNVMQVIQSRRYFNSALKLLLPLAKRQTLIEQSKMINVGPSSTDEESGSCMEKQVSDKADFPTYPHVAKHHRQSSGNQILPISTSAAMTAQEDDVSELSPHKTIADV